MASLRERVPVFDLEGELLLSEGQPGMRVKMRGLALSSDGVGGCTVQFRAGLDYLLTGALRLARGTPLVFPVENGVTQFSAPEGEDLYLIVTGAPVSGWVILITEP